MSKAALLCVDDEIAILRALKEQFKRLFGKKYIYEVAQSAEEAWEIIGEFEEDEVDILIIVSDWLMPNVRGDEFLGQVHQKFPNIVKIMLTGQADDDAIARAVEKANLYACIHKPWHEEELEKIIETALQS
ncbi:MAG: response regulator [Acaryochloridaceae cyanobacterium RL_2_7]|nr:response regulator [Acaryochloridaceae cyanobacterium RL_2_7]